MDDPQANAQLELACRLGSLSDVIDALDDGANIDCNGYSPIFFAIQNADSALAATLVERGADVSAFGIDAEGDVVDQLMKMSPKDEAQDEVASDGMAELDAKLIRAFNRMICNKEIAEPINKGRRDEFPAFCDGLQSIAAEECHAVISEFLELLKTATADESDADTAITAFLKDEGNAACLTDLSERYAKASEEEQPGELLKDYLKERKKVA